MTLQQIESIVNECINMITVDAKGLAEARDRAAKFLTAQALLNNYMLTLDVEIGKHETVTEVSYAKAIRETDGKNITEKKTYVIENPLYRNERDKLKEMEAQKQWIKTHMKIFENAHLMYRQLARD